MTIDEAYILLNFHLPCVFISGHSTEAISNKEFRITAVKQSYQQWSRTYVYSATLENDGRAVYEVEISNIAPVAGYEGMIYSKIKQYKKAQLKELLLPLIENLKTKKAIYAFIGKLIDEIKADGRDVA